MYVEWAAELPHVIAWRSTVAPGTPPTRILPDGCLDVIWHDGTVFVAGPDTTAQVSGASAGSTFFALRFAAGTGPGVLGLPADELTDRQVPLDQICAPAEVRALSEADDPLAALDRFTRRRWHAPDSVMVAVAAQARAGRPVGAIADRSGLSPRQLQRRCRTAFGYGPKSLAKILRMQRAVGLARAGRPFAEVSTTAGYADQAHLSRDVKALAGVPLGDLVS
ncbi:helix-turn-helix domain-containing protein [Actinoplanes friuliensis]|uniref:AraC family transcriptional regulator n=1 Tax=Actinoplanes friuliensis DSM 7358 TaxID=1246995 RepID=U5VRU1_9ACTN|nr:helix-turn-helix transcriptional regulator [Actinoplanes friuliensis]AGZ39544.1 AraC family transcriptional regulator [Actinoplanes friuliensis DSM 7358]